MMSHRLCIGWLVLLGAALAHAEPERERIAAERAAANARFSDQERLCEERFVVTSCVDAARRELRMTLTRLHRVELTLDEAARRETATRRRQAVNDKAAAQEARASAPTEVTRRDTARAPPAPNPPVPASGTNASPQPADERRAIEQRNEANFEARARAAQAHRDAVERRNAQRSAQGKGVAPLPLPSGASAP